MARQKKTLRKKRIKRILLTVCGLITLGVISFFAIQIHMKQTTKAYIFSDVSEFEVCDAVMVLGASVYSSGRPSPLLADRLDKGYELYVSGKAKKILVSGDHGQSNYDEVNSMRNYLLEKGAPREDIFMDHAGFNTYDSMYRAKEVFRVETLLISTQEFHINRAVYIARKLGITAFGYPGEDKEAYGMRYLNARESLARVKAFWDTAIRREPKYLGDAIPITGSGVLTEG